MGSLLLCRRTAPQPSDPDIHCRQHEQGEHPAPCRNRRLGPLLAMRRRRPSLALGLSLLLLNLLASVLPPAAHAAAHHGATEHLAASHDDHHDVSETAVPGDLTEHEHIVVKATTTQARPTLDVLPTSLIVVPPVHTLATSRTNWIPDDRPQHPSRTHDPPSAPRAPPSR